MKTSFTYLAVITLVLFMSQSLFSQQAKVNADSLFKEAQSLLKKGDYTQAQKICVDLLENNPNNFDARLLLANSYMWKKKFPEARPHIDYLLSHKENNKDALTANINWHLWSDDYAGSLNHANNALKHFPNDVDFNLKKAHSLKNLDELNQATIVVDSVLAKEPDNKEALKLKQALFLLSSKNKLTVSYVIDFYENDSPLPTQLAYIEYARKIKKHTVIGRVNYGNRYNKEGIQLESDAYLKTTKKAYMYLNVGYSPSENIFPDYRAGAEWYQSFGKGNEASLGFRYLNFSPKNIFIYTASYGKYVGAWWFAGRTFVTPKDNDASVSGLLYVRRYCTKYNYIGLQLKTGVNPDERANLIDPSNNYFFNSSGVRLEYNTLFLTRWIAAFDIVYENQEYWTNKYRNVISFDVKFSYLF